MKARYFYILPIAAFCLGAGALVEFIHIRNKNPPQKTEVQTSEVPTSEAPTLVELIIKEYEDSNDPNQLIACASIFEQGYEHLNSFTLYEKINDVNSMQRIATTNFIESVYPVKGLIERAGLETNAELYNKRGDYFFEKGHFLHKALEAYENAGNDEGKMGVALKLEENGEVNNHRSENGGISCLACKVA